VADEARQQLPRDLYPAPNPPPLDLGDYDYDLPPECIAQHPARERDGARLLALGRHSGALRHGRVRDLDGLLAPGDLVVLNATRVLPARLRGKKLASGGHAEALLLGPAQAPGSYQALLRVSGRVRCGLRLRLAGLEAEVQSLAGQGQVTLRFAADAEPYARGEAPLPPYIRRQGADAADGERYQTVYARVPGSVAAPTAGLHLSERLLASLDAAGVERTELVLHVGPGTFRPLQPEDLAARRLHHEAYELPDACAEAVERTRSRGGRVVAVGTTSARVLEACAGPDGRLRPGSGTTDLFLTPGCPFRVVDALLTNFHLPRSSLLLLAAAFAGRERLLHAYAQAIASGYRFYSYGDAMFIA
jgi:S-adenosylmethionine:tRNA ribosyltransferase-isomerase